MEGRPIDTIGYRGMHSYEVAFDRWWVPAANLIGGDEGLGRGFYFQMEGFENGRLQTAARAVGLMQAAFDAGLAYAQERRVFGQSVFDYQLSKAKLARMAFLIQAGRQFSYEVARRMARGEGTLEASMVKAYVCRAAEWVTREAMQVHGGMGYAEEFPVSRAFVDARVLSIFEGADETLCLRVIARRLDNALLQGIDHRGTRPRCHELRKRLQEEEDLRPERRFTDWDRLCRFRIDENLVKQKEGRLIACEDLLKDVFPRRLQPLVLLSDHRVRVLASELPREFAP